MRPSSPAPEAGGPSASAISASAGATSYGEVLDDHEERVERDRAERRRHVVVPAHDDGAPAAGCERVAADPRQHAERRAVDEVRAAQVDQHRVGARPGQRRPRRPQRAASRSGSVRGDREPRAPSHDRTTPAGSALLSMAASSLDEQHRDVVREGRQLEPELATHLSTVTSDRANSGVESVVCRPRSRAEGFRAGRRRTPPAPGPWEAPAVLA